MYQLSDLEVTNLKQSLEITRLEIQNRRLVQYCQTLKNTNIELLEEIEAYKKIKKLQKGHLTPPKKINSQKEDQTIRAPAYKRSTLKFDLDSILIMVPPKSLQILLGVRSFLGHRPANLYGDPMSKKMCIFVTEPIHVFINYDDKGRISQGLKEMGFVFEQNPKVTSISSKKVSIATSIVIYLLEKLEIKSVRIVAHDLKDPLFHDYLTKIEIVEDESNRYDFGKVQYTKSHILFDHPIEPKPNYEVFPMFGQQMGTLRNLNRKVYQVSYHHLKRRTTINTAFWTLNNRSTKDNIIKIRSFIDNQLDFSPGLRYQVSHFNASNSPKQIIRMGEKALFDWINELKTFCVFHLSRQQKLQRVETIFKIMIKQGIPANSKPIEQDTLFLYASLLNAIGFSTIWMGKHLPSLKEDFQFLLDEDQEEDMLKQRRSKDIAVLKANRRKRQAVQRNNQKRKKITKRKLNQKKGLERMNKK